MYSSYYILGNGRNKYKKMNSPGEIFSVLRRMAKPTSIAARIGFYLFFIKNSVYFSRAMDVDLAPSITKQQPFGSWAEWKFQTCARLSAPHAHTSHGGHHTSRGPLNHSSSSKRKHKY